MILHWRSGINTENGKKRAVKIFFHVSGTGDFVEYFIHNFQAIGGSELSCGMLTEKQILAITDEQIAMR